MCEAMIGLLGAVVGAGAVLGSTILQHWLAERQQDKLDAPRMEMLKSMLENPPQGATWRKIETLSRVIGASRDDTTRLLIKIKARGNEQENDVWGLISKHPLP
jgi:hypothetical protein